MILKVLNETILQDASMHGINLIFSIIFEQYANCYGNFFSLKMCLDVDIDIHILNMNGTTEQRCLYDVHDTSF